MSPQDKFDLWLALNSFMAGSLATIASLGMWLLVAEAIGM